MLAMRLNSWGLVLVGNGLTTGPWTSAIGGGARKGTDRRGLRVLSQRGGGVANWGGADGCPMDECDRRWGRGRDRGRDLICFTE